MSRGNEGSQYLLGIVFVSECGQWPRKYVGIVVAQPCQDHRGDQVR